MKMVFPNPQHEALLDDVVGEALRHHLGFDKFSVIVGYPQDLNGDSLGFPGFPLSKIDPSKPFIIEADKSTFWSRMNELYPGKDEIPNFFGRVCNGVFMGGGDDKIFHIGQ